MKSAHRLAFWCAAIVVGLLHVGAYRYYVNPDGLSYIELAWAGVWHGLSGFVNGYWSPLYPALLSIVFWAVRPSPASESTVVHLVNFAIFLANLACFEVFLRELLLARAASAPPAGGRARLPDQTLWTWGYIFFLWATTMWLRPMLVTPDLCVAALCYLATAILLRIHRQGRQPGRDGGTWPVYLLLGVVLGLAYLAKAFMFLLGWVFIACSLWAARSKREALPRAVAAALVFLIIAAPEILALSRAKGRWTFGDTGSLNYAWYVDRVPSRYGLGVQPQAGVPVHPAREVLTDPPIYDFATPLIVTDPPGFNPSYWYAGVHPYVSLRGQARALLGSLSLILQMFSRSGTLYALFLVLTVLLWKSGRWFGAGPPQWAVWMPAYVAFGLYSLVHIEPRFVGEFGLMLLMGLFAAIQPARHRIEGGNLLLPAIGVTFLAVATILFYSVGDLNAVIRHKPDPVFVLARQIEIMGLSSGNYAGSRVDPLDADNARGLAGRIGSNAGAYWAHLAGLRIVADVANPEDYWKGDAATRERVMQTFAQLGIRVVVAEPPSRRSRAGPIATVPPAALEGWTPVPSTDFYIYRIAGRSSTPER